MKKFFSMIAVVTLLTCTFGQLALAEVGISPMAVCNHKWAILATTTSKYVYLSAARHAYNTYRDEVCTLCSIRNPNPALISSVTSYHEWDKISDRHLMGQYKHEYVDKCKQCKEVVTTIKVCTEHE